MKNIFGITLKSIVDRVSYSIFRRIGDVDTMSCMIVSGELFWVHIAEPTLDLIAHHPEDHKGFA